MQCPSVILSVSYLDPVGPQLLQKRDRLFKMIEVLSMDYQVGGESDAVLTNPSRNLDLMCIRFGPRDPIRALLLRILKTQLDMVESRVHQPFQALA